MFWILMTLSVFSVYGADLGGKDVCSDGRCARSTTTPVRASGHVLDDKVTVLMNVLNARSKMAVTKEVFGEENPENHKIIQTLIFQKNYFDGVALLMDDVACEKVKAAAIDFLEQAQIKSKTEVMCATEPVKSLFETIREKVTDFKKSCDLEEDARRAVKLYASIGGAWAMVYKCLQIAFFLDDYPILKTQFYLALLSVKRHIEGYDACFDGKTP